ncbi:MAG: hypothetical protein ABI790_13790, partial [Betaproteobacteria bacterium]
MLMIWIKKLLLLWMIVWLPVSGAIAAVMPLTRSASTPVVAENASAGDQGVATPMPCHNTAGKVHAGLGEGCNHCVLCHLAGALTLSTLPVVPSVPPSHVFSAAPIASHPSFVPELLIPPPRFALA